MSTKGDNAEACDISETQKNEKAPVFFVRKTCFQHMLRISFAHIYVKKLSVCKLQLVLKGILFAAEISCYTFKTKWFL